MPADSAGYPLHFHSSSRSFVEQPDQIAQLFQQSLHPAQARTQLPLERPGFIGRLTVIEKALAMMQAPPETGSRVLALAGGAGIGKSTLALKLAHRLRSRYPDAQLYINLRGTDHQPVSPSTVLAQWLGLWGLAAADLPPTLVQQAELWQTISADRQMVIVLDNVANAEQIQPLLPNSTRSTVLVTTRNPQINLGTVLTVEPLTELEAIALLRTECQYDFILSDLESARRIVQQCDRSPLAIGLAGSALAQMKMSLNEFAAKWGDEYQRFQQTGASYPAIRAGFSLVYQSLDAHAAHVLRSLSLLAEPILPVGAATPLVDLSPDQLEPLFQSLANAHLFNRIEPGWYQWHDVIRLMARGQLALEVPAPARQAIRMQLCTWYQATIEVMSLGLQPAVCRRLAQAFKSGRRQEVETFEQSLLLGATRWLERQQMNGIVVIDWAYQAEQWEQVAQLVCQLSQSFGRTACWGEWQRTLTLALDAAQRVGDGHIEAQLLNNLGNAHAQQQQWSKAQAAYEASVSKWQDQNAPLREAQTLANLGVVYLVEGDRETATALWSTAINKLLPHTPDYKEMVQWMQAIDPALVADVSQLIGDRSITNDMLGTIKGILKRLIQEP